MSNYAHKIFHLYPTATEEDFRLEDDLTQIVLKEWNTAKLGVKPTLASLDIQVDDATADAAAVDRERERKFNKDVIKAIGLTMKDFMNEIIDGSRTTKITNSELRTKFISYL